MKLYSHRSSLLVTYLVSVILLLVAAHQPPQTPVTPLTPAEPRFEAGIIVQPSQSYSQEEQDNYYRLVAEDLYLPWVKQEVRWESIETAPGQYQWDMLDLTLASAQRFQLKTLLTITGTPDFYREPGVDLNRDGPPAEADDFSRFLRAMLERYPGQIHGIEIWQDMNLDRGWTSTKGLSAANYVALLREAFTTIKSIDPYILVISGALTPTGYDNGINAIDDFRYMEMLIAAGMLSYVDCVGASHNGINMPALMRYNIGYNDPTSVYRGPFDNPHHSWSFRSTLEGYIQRIWHAGSQTPLCVTRFGWASSEVIGGFPSGFEFAGDNSLQEQANWTIDALNLMQGIGTVRLAVLENFNYGPGAGWSKDDKRVPYSLIGPEWQFRPAYYALQGWQYRQQP
jgi:polysaccharide biosynthesis protein PslG